MSELQGQNGQKNSTIGLVSSDFVVRFWAEADNRLAVVRELRRRAEQLKADAGADSTQKAVLCERVVFVVCRLESLELDAVESGKFDSGLYIALTNTLTGLLRLLGCERRTKKIASNLQDYVKRSKKANNTF